MNLRLLIIFSSATAIAGSLLGLFFYQQSTIASQKYDALINEASVREKIMLGQIHELKDQYANTLALLDLSEEEKNDLADDLEKQKEKVDDIEDEYEKINETVEKLVKLNNTDEELLQKYSKVYFLNENYVPTRLKDINSDYLIGSKSLQIHAEVAPFLEEMLEDADDDGMDLRIVSAYRSFDYQKQIKAVYVTQYGSGANTFSADQGYSEHQLGSTVDFSTPTNGSSLSAFASTDEFAWLQKNAYKYGFILSYPDGNSHYQYEPWHWRFVGEDLARYIRKEDVDFYDIDQRDIDEYLLDIFD